MRSSDRSRTPFPGLCTALLPADTEQERVGNVLSSRVNNRAEPPRQAVLRGSRFMLRWPLSQPREDCPLCHEGEDVTRCDSATAE